jgi:glycine/D-amino acid oxidase-like deaminating enzyme
MSTTLDIDVAVIGGGIAGLWLLARLRLRGYAALLVEADRLGAGQTICAQGIIHGGAKYTLTGHLSAAARRIAAMPTVWRRCLNGDGEVALNGARLLSPYQYLWTSKALSSRLTGFFAGRAMADRMQALTPEAFPEPLRHSGFRGTVYRLDEPVVDVGSVLRTLARAQTDAIVRNDGPADFDPDGTIRLRSGDRRQVVRARAIVLTAGAGNAAMGGAPMQRRPLHMAMARGPGLMEHFCAHCLGAGALPRLTITAHRDRIGQLIWYLGGRLAEQGVDREPEAQADAARRELARSLPRLNPSALEIATLRVDRAESRQADGKRPDRPGVVQRDRVISAWPTKLAMAPMLAEAVMARLEQVNPEPGSDGCREALYDWPRPAVAAFPWDEDGLTWY